MARPVERAERVQLAGARPREQPVPGVGADRGDYLQRAFRDAEPDRSPEARYIWQEVAHGVLATGVDRKDEEYRRGGQRADDRLRCRLLNRLRWHSLRSPSASSAPSFPHPPAPYARGPPRNPTASPMPPPGSPPRMPAIPPRHPRRQSTPRRLARGASEAPH